jgi:hypothetical protein
MSPLARSLKVLQQNGWQSAKTEHYNSFSKRRVDLFGFIDILAVKGPATLALQPTSDSNVSARVRKVYESPYLPAVLAAGWKVEVWGWAKRRALGSQRETWQVRRVAITAEGLCSGSSQVSSSPA